ncbi:GNAT family N-acetyltransferase [Microbacterium sp. T2.11-28]|uniref:GNAT family N-acetyltransferase n=1 Tax=Microbacterium sp. T2.11-28 TaxID=3041169 RepID=UPI0024779C4B|nr:GNAT family N-acetyltransferase [Microbacterium sp. T2.11-28]CAI9386867.1 N-acetyltransferase Eis [Microbacterium sp. T2.11-28]
MTDLDTSFHDAPLDAELSAQLAAQRLDVRRVDDASRAEVDAWLDAVSRGFLDGERNDTQRQAFFDRGAYRRKLGVFDADAPHPEVPVATFASWGTRLTVPGGAATACAISSVTVAPTHRRRGLLRTLMAGELRTAAAAGFAVAVLTVSESGIYGRFGFAPAASAAHWRIDVRRAGWRGPDAPEAGRIDFITREEGRALAEALHDRVRAATPGEIDMPGGHWDRFFGTRPDAEKAEALRVVQYRSPAGAVEGLALYRVAENHDDFAASTIDLDLLLAATDAAYSGLWRFFLSMDLIGTIRAGELSVDEPLWWMIADQRAATITVRDHQYVRVLDPAAALEARCYAVADEIVLEIDDPLGIATGPVVLRTEPDGTARVLDAGAAGDDPLRVRLGVAELSAILLGGVSPSTLARAGRLHTDDPSRVTRLFAGTQAPSLGFWY